MQSMKGCLLLLICFIESVPLNASNHSISGSSSTSQETHHRVRRFLFTKNSRLAFDIHLMIPIPMLGGIDVMAMVEIPLTVTMLNDTFVFNQIPIPYVVIPQPEPIPPQYPAYIPSYYGDPQMQSYPGTDYSNPAHPHFHPHPHPHPVPPPSHQHYYGQYPHPMKRSLGAASAQHRYDLFSTLSQTIEEFGVDGKACICKAVCQLARTPMLIESPFHEIVEHILTVSRAFDEESLLVEYMEAEKLGQSQEDCKKYFECAFDLFEPVHE